MSFWRRKGKARSSSVAKERLKLVLVHDRLNLTPEALEELRRELVEVVSRHLEVDAASVLVELKRGEGTELLEAKIPVRRARRSPQ